METNIAEPQGRISNGLAARLLLAGNASENRLRRRRAVVFALTRRLSWLISSLFFVGYLWMILIPLPRLSRGTYIDENALQPGQVTTYFDWEDVHAADNYLEALEVLQSMNATYAQRAQFMKTELNKLGICASTHNYAFSTNTGRVTGTNAYGILYSPRTAGTEAVVISASWLSKSGTPNLRGISTILALAGFLKRYSLWAKDIIFVVSDGYLDGMHAWLAAYHGSLQSNTQMDPLELSSGVIWTALNIDYPGHSFSHLGMFFAGMNGRLPNQDLLNSFQRISLYAGGVPVVLDTHIENQETFDPLLSRLPNLIREQPEIRKYLYQAKNMIDHFGHQARGRASGVHGLFHRYRIDAFTLFAVPATGPHGFHAIGRVIESTLRTVNNLLEPLHASFFFYVLTDPDHFLKIGSYLPSAVLVSVAMMFCGLRTWVDAAWTSDQPHVDSSKTGGSTSSTMEWSRRRQPIIGVLVVICTTHIIGAFLFGLLTSSWFMESQELATPLVFLAFGYIPLLVLLISPLPGAEGSPFSQVLKAINLCFASTVISIVSVLNFALAGSLAILLGLPLSIAFAGGPLLIRTIRYTAYILLGLGWLLFPSEVRRAIWDWEVLSVWFAPFVCLVYVPLLLQAGLVCLLSS